MVKRPRPIAWMMLDGISLIDGFFQFFFQENTTGTKGTFHLNTRAAKKRVYLRIVWSQLLYLLNSSIAHHLARKPSSIKMRRNHHVWTNSISKHPWISSYWVIFSGPCRHLPTRKKNTDSVRRRRTMLPKTYQKATFKSLLLWSWGQALWITTW